MHRALAFMARFVGVRPLYAAMAVFAVPCYLLLHFAATMSVWHYLRRRHGFGLFRSLWLTWLNHYRFGQVVIDRFAMYAGVTFRLERVNNDLFMELCRGDEGFVILSSHVGNYEMCGYTFRSVSKACNVLVYGGEARTVMSNRRRMFSANNIAMIPFADDMSHIFALNGALADGEIVSIPADRVFGSSKTVTCRLLGATARLPLGPFALAAHRQAKAIAIFVMKESAMRYTVYVCALDAGLGLKPNDRVQALAQAFATELEKVLRRYPEQWYNYYEFWENE